MSYRKCPYSNEACKYWNYPSVVLGETNGCRANKHHLYKLEEARELGSVAVAFSNLARNKIQLCQVVHEDIEATYGWLVLPSRAVMRAIISADDKLTLHN
jgi:hypothetical protein